MPKIVNLDSYRAEVKTQRSTTYAGINKTVVAPKPPKRVNVEHPLSKEQRGELNALIKDWVETSDRMRKPLPWGKAWNKLYTDCLLGKVGYINEIESAEFAECKRWIQQQIKITESANLHLARKNPNYTKRLETRILARCTALGVSTDTRHKYALERWGSESLTGLSHSQLEEFYQYVSQDNPSFVFKARANASEHDLRVRALMAWLEDMEREDVSFDRRRITMTKPEILGALQARDRTLFAMSESTFNDFWDKRPRDLCTLKRGRPPTNRLSC